MKTGANWYKREPIAFLGGIQGMSAKHIVVYTVVLELIYAHGGAIHNDPKWVSGWIGDMGAAAVRGCISDLVEAGKLIIEGDQITEKRAKNEAKTKEKLSENRAFSGRIGGVSSGKSRSKSKENNEIDEASASSLLPLDKIREEYIPPKSPKGERVRDVLIEVVRPDTADAFIAHRKAKRAKMSEKAASLIAEKLRGHPDPDSVVLLSIQNGWTGVFPESHLPKSQPKPQDDKRSRWQKLAGAA